MTLTQAALDDRTLLAIGRIIRACAEIEDTINLFICNLANISESTMVVLLGQTPISKRVEIAQYLAKMRPDEASKAAEHVFTDAFFSLLHCRNTVAHGVLLGRTQDGSWAFLTSRTQPPIVGSAFQEALVYSPKSLGEFAATAEQAIPRLEQFLRIEGPRRSRHERPLSPHRKGLRQQKQASGPKPPRSPSAE
jgi:hypothetical protein